MDQPAGTHPASAPLDWTQSFSAFSPAHGVVVAVATAMVVVAVMLGVRWRGTANEKVLRTSWGLTILAFIASADAYWLMPARYKGEFSWPLQVCDLVAIVSCLCLVLPWRALKTVTVFHGIALCSQAFITPVVPVGPAFLHFWYFWLSHLAILGGAAYVIVVDRYRPKASDLGLACLFLYAYVGWVLPLDIAKGWNYGYVGMVEPKSPTIVNKLGAWPERVYWLGVLGSAGMVVVYLVFAAAGWIGGTRSAATKATEAV